jgi:hypothetical protein
MRSVLTLVPVFVLMRGAACSGRYSAPAPGQVLAKNREKEQ